MHGVRAARVLREQHVVVVHIAGPRVVQDFIEDDAEADGAEYLRLSLLGEIDAPGVATALDVEDALRGPDVLVVADWASGARAGPWTKKAADYYYY